MPIAKKAVKENKAVAFLNWAIPTKNGGEVKGDKGFPIFQNPAYPSAKEDMLINLAQQHGGSVELTMKVRISLNRQAPEVDLNDLVLFGEKPATPAKKKPAKKKAA